MLHSVGAITTGVFSSSVIQIKNDLSLNDFVKNGAISFEIGLTYSVIPKRYGGLSIGLLGSFLICSHSFLLLMCMEY